MAELTTLSPVVVVFDGSRDGAFLTARERIPEVVDLGTGCSVLGLAKIAQAHPRVLVAVQRRRIEDYPSAGEIEVVFVFKREGNTAWAISQR